LHDDADEVRHPGFVSLDLESRMAKVDFRGRSFSSSNRLEVPTTILCGAKEGLVYELRREDGIDLIRMGPGDTVCPIEKNASDRVVFAGVSESDRSHQSGRCE
jgi:hypothetical protein